MTTRTSLALKVPAVVAAFMLIVAAFISQHVLSRLEDIQRNHLQALTRVYLDGLSTALVEPVLREDVWETFAILDRARDAASGLRSVETIVTAQDGRILAATNPHRFPTASALTTNFPTVNAVGLTVREDEARAYARRDIEAGGRRLGAIHAELDIASLVEERRDVLWTLVLSNAALSALLVGIAWFTVRRMLRPVRILGRHLEAGTSGAASDIPAEEIAGVGPEFQRLFSAFNRLAQGFREREGLTRQLAEEERLASLGRLTSGMAHEINNPLGGLFTALDTLKQHGHHSEVRVRTIDLIDRGLRGIRDVVRSALLTYRADHDGRNLTPQDMDDLRILASPEARRNGLSLTWQNRLDAPVPLPASTVRQIVLNLLLNACLAAPRNGAVLVAISHADGLFTIVVADSGPGLPESAAATLASGAAPSAPIASGTGLGLWMTRRLVDELGGRIRAGSSPLGGAEITVTIATREVEVIAHVA
jgi:two-component system OmpR family sensor kinase